MTSGSNVGTDSTNQLRSENEIEEHEGKAEFEFYARETLESVGVRGFPFKRIDNPSDIAIHPLYP